MVKPNRKPVTDKMEAKRLEALQRALLGLHDELTETFAWSALLCEGLCGLMTEHSTDIDPVTHTGMRFATIWLKRRNQGHATHLQTACGMLREIRERQRQLRRQKQSSNMPGGRR
jgi:gamma-glutamyl:cysteine ligase YbdK (ATP-grasp superfamily)